MFFLFGLLFDDNFCLTQEIQHFHNNFVQHLLPKFIILFTFLEI